MIIISEMKQLQAQKLIFGLFIVSLKYGSVQCKYSVVTAVIAQTGCLMMDVSFYVLCMLFQILFE